MSAQPPAAPGDVPAATGPRMLRAAVFAAVCVVLSALGHVLAACAAVPWWTLLVGFLAVAAVVAPLAGRSRSLPALVAALAGGQLGLHSLFGLAQHPSRVAPGTDDIVVRLAAKLTCGAAGEALDPTEAHRIVTAAGIDPAAAARAGRPGLAESVPNAALESGGLLPSLPMLLGHLLAAVVTGWLLRRGDLALLRLTELSTQGAQGAGGMVAEGALVRALRAALVLVRQLLGGLPAMPGTARGRTGAEAGDCAPPVAALQHTVVRRGPPARRIPAARIPAARIPAACVLAA
ncbi:hypothetical protein [Streptomyces pacificus]|uniref:Integral membrane protein n=1 Tax=Streptomyces pacificus TaxID=2705029 RepID=A0A6A0B0G8_9ACTN|nr:hypothetical protein [Streptomyces pacificus]GFH38710.1 hypothetical protein SCWH03_49580 [Streptomyces pacificus]